MSLPVSVQQRFLKEAQNSVKKNAYFMRKAMVSVTLCVGPVPYGICLRTPSCTAPPGGLTGLAIALGVHAGRGQPAGGPQVLSSNAGRAQNLIPFTPKVLRAVHAGV